MKSPLLTLTVASSLHHLGRHLSKWVSSVQIIILKPARADTFMFYQPLKTVSMVCVLLYSGAVILELWLSKSLSTTRKGLLFKQGSVVLRKTKRSRQSKKHPFNGGLTPHSLGNPLVEPKVTYWQRKSRIPKGNSMEVFQIGGSRLKRRCAIVVILVKEN